MKSLLPFAILTASTFGADLDFVRDVQPILEAKCVKCHGPEKQKGGYRLDVKTIALTGGENHAPSIVPGKSAESPLVQFVSGADPDMKMPPKGEGLDAKEQATIRRWIDEGAQWPDAASAKTENPLDWWSLKPIARPEVPGPAANPIDAFVSAKLKAHGLSMAPEADPRTLCRRLYFDLIGLPPTPGEIAAFEKACASEGIDAAYGALVDRLLASPRHGERWARHWLDVVHYGDTHGYDKDQPRPHAWPYRDYVIRAFNEDKPYARFVEEQIAGDVIYPGTRDGIEALGFIAAGPWDFIGHVELPEDKIDGKIARHLDRDDMAGTAIGTFSSVTVQCAQCHHHKFDPVSQEDYFAVQAVFAALDRANKTYDIDPAVAAKRAELGAQKTALEAKEKQWAAKIARDAGPALAAVEKEIAAAEKTASQGRRPEYGWHSGIEPRAETRKWVQVDLGASTPLDRVVLAGVWDDFNGIGAGFGFPVRFRVEAGDDPEFGGVPLVIAAHDLEDFPNPGTTPRVFSATGKTARYVRVTATKLAPRQNDFIFALAELQVFDAAGRNAAAGSKVASIDSIEAPVRWRRSNLTDGIFPAATGGDAALAALREKRAAMVAAVTTDEGRRERDSAQAELRAVTKRLAALPAPRTVFAGTVHTGGGNFRGTGATGGKPRPIHLLARGQVTAPGREIPPGSLSALTMLPSRFEPAGDDEGARRAALARWFTAKENPLTWRSIVNRVWQYHFGRGIVETSNDFGRMGALPTHPALLDWLTSAFRDDMGGSLKALHRLIVTSAAYRQSSRVRNEAAEKSDATNTLLWRQNPRKLEAEVVRDAVLAVSGKLDLAMGGPGWQDFAIERPEHSPHYLYAKADPEDGRTWRRGVYRFIVRSQMQPFLTSLDCADPSMRVDRRNESVSPAQALALLNNGFMVSQARHFAARVESESGPGLPERIRHAFTLALGRPPSEAEAETLTAYAAKHGLPNACRLIFNLNEFAFAD